jgi:nicotinate phosphoribosyltransferase
MLTDTFTAQAFFVDFISNPERALRWGSLRQDSGDPFKFVREAKEAYRKVEDAAGVKREDDIVAKGKRIIFSDGLDVDSAVALQKGCDEIGMAGGYLVLRARQAY